MSLWHGSLPLEEQKLWFPNQLAHEPDSWTFPHLLNLKTGYDVLVKEHDCKVQEMYSVQVILLPLMNLSCYRLSIAFTRIMCEIRSCPSRGILDQLWHRLKVHFQRTWWKSGNRGKQTCESRTTQGCFSNWIFTHNKLLRQKVLKTLTPAPRPIIIIRPFYPLKCTHLTQVTLRHTFSIGNPWDFSAISNVVPTAIGSLFHFGRFGFDLFSVCQFRY